MRHLARGVALDAIVSGFEKAGYSWAYRLIDTRAFGLPQRRERIFILASKDGDPRDVLLSKDAGPPASVDPPPGTAFGFYWTEGRGGLGWAVNAVPTLKNGSTIGIASPPAIWLPDGRFVKPGIRDAERMQGFVGGWTKSAESIDRRCARWRLVGNAVTVDVAEWLGQQLIKSKRYRDAGADVAIPKGAAWPQAAYNVGAGRFASRATSNPVRRKALSLSDFLCDSETVLLSHRAITGFLSRFDRGNLRPPVGFLEAAREHQSRMARLTA
jgi:DNA (cytosine-5)-methyltransferase 1